MARKFQIDPEEFENKKTIQNDAEEDKEVVDEPKEDSETVRVNEVQKTDEVKEMASEPAVDSKEEAVKQPIVNVTVSEPEITVPAVKNNNYVQIKVQRKERKETKSVRKQVLLKPSLVAQIESVLASDYDGKI